MSIVILVGGTSREGNYEHRYLVSKFLEHFGDEVKAVITTDPVQRSFVEKVKRTLKRGNYLEKLARIKYDRETPKNPELLGDLLFSGEESGNKLQTMPGGERTKVVSGHNAADCENLIKDIAPDVIVVYGTLLIKENIFSLAKKCTLNMHTGLSPYYRGDSTLFWPVYYNDKEHLGVTVHQLVPEVDGGDIVYTGKVEYTAGDTESHIFSKGVQIGTELYIQAVKDALGDNIVYHKQDLSLGREFRWIQRTVEADKKVAKTLAEWASEKPSGNITKLPENRKIDSNVNQNPETQHQGGKASTNGVG